MPVRLNLGAGFRHFDPADGWINIDLPNNEYGYAPDVAADVRKLPFEDEYADEIHGIHILEHFYIWEVPAILTEWNRVLKTGGMLYLELPDLLKIVENLKSGEGCMKTWAGLYGDPTVKNPDMTHKWGYTFPMIERILMQTGFTNVIKREPYFHVPIRDMRVIARKAAHVPEPEIFVSKKVARVQ
jgi:predicted SAM-dependent methyltransferase